MADKNKSKLRIIAIIILLLLGLGFIFARENILFLLGSAKGLLLLNWMIYTAVAIASFTVSYVMRRVYGPFIERGLRRLFGRK